MVWCAWIFSREDGKDEATKDVGAMLGVLRIVVFFVTLSEKGGILSQADAHGVPLSATHSPVTSRVDSDGRASMVGCDSGVASGGEC